MKHTLSNTKQKAIQFMNCHHIDDLKKLNIDVNRIKLLALHPAYYSFKIRKSNGKFRQIEAPEPELKEVQRQLNGYLQAQYYLQQTPAAYGYIIHPKNTPNNKSILENAKRHLGNAYMLHVDFKNFFHQIKTPKIVELLHQKSFNFDKKSALTLSKIFTYNNRLPMGAPTSPVLSNFATIDFDNEMHTWATGNGITFTRFVDDLNFSHPDKPITTKHLDEITKICQKHQLVLNSKKTEFFNKNDTKKVTGLVLRNTVDIDDGFYNELHRDLKRLQSIAEINLIMETDNRNELLRKFKKEVEGKINFIGMIEGYNSSLFHKYRQKMKKALTPDEQVFISRWSNSNYF